MLTAMTALFGTLATLGTPQIQGDYVEARTADVYTGPCFSNAEVFITGKHAVMAWKIREGTYAGQNLAGLSMAAALEGTSTFSKDVPSETRSVLMVDRTATPAQRDALVALAKELAGERLNKVLEVKTATIDLNVEDLMPHSASTGGTPHHGMPKAARASLKIPGLADILTRPLEEEDHACGNEVIEYPPLSSGVDVLPAYTLRHGFRGENLGTTWNDPNCRSSFVGHFQR